MIRAIILVFLSSMINQVAFADTSGLISNAKVDSIICGELLTIQDHMMEMGFKIRVLREKASSFVKGNVSQDLKDELMSDVQVLRTHLIAVMPKVPKKILAIDPNNIQENKITFQKYILKMVTLTLTVESELLKNPSNASEDLAQRVKIADTLIAIDETVKAAHNLFRH